jgi:hypothetical protein
MGAAAPAPAEATTKERYSSSADLRECALRWLTPQR